MEIKLPNQRPRTALPGTSRTVAFPLYIMRRRAVGVTKSLNHLGVFAKYWQPGHVKTRLAASIGEKPAASLYRELVRQTLERFRFSAAERSLWISPPESAASFAELAGSNWPIHYQPEGDLGERMLKFFRSIMAANPTHPPKVILLGADSPTLPTIWVEHAFDLLDQHECVLGPSLDGGYYLIGLKRPETTLFEDIQWSSPSVFTETVRRLEDRGRSWASLSEWNDVDYLDDVRWLRNQLPAAESRNRLDQELFDAIDFWCGDLHENQ